MNLLEATEAFMVAAGQCDQEPTFNDIALLDLRIDLLAEEYTEWIQAILDDDHEEMIDALLDIVVVAWGTAIALIGKQKTELCAAEVARSNLDKIGPDGKVTRREDGKILKPESWRGPDIKAILNVGSSDE